MKLRVAALCFGLATGFVFGWARMTDPETFHRMLALDSPRIYLLMGAAVAVSFVGSKLLRGRRALLSGEPIAWTTTLPARAHVLGGVVFGIGWGISSSCPGPIAAQLGTGRVLALAVAGGVLVGVWAQPRLAALSNRVRRPQGAPIAVAPASDVL